MREEDDYLKHQKHGGIAVAADEPPAEEPGGEGDPKPPEPPPGPPDTEG